MWLTVSASGFAVAIAASLVVHLLLAWHAAYVLSTGDDRVGGPLFLLFFLLCAAGAHAAAVALFVEWFRRAHRNAQLLDPAGQRFGQVWAVVGWLVPLVHLWLPKAVANGIWRSSTPASTAVVMRRLWSGVFHTWWGLWVGWQLCAVLGVWLSGGYPWFLATEALLIATGLLTLVVVARLTFMQQRRITELDDKRNRTQWAAAGWHVPRL
ncbi:DUF4328 domain-containing protein [Streptomyces sp. NPDC001070]